MLRSLLSLCQATCRPHSQMQHLGSFPCQAPRSALLYPYRYAPASLSRCWP